MPAFGSGLIITPSLRAAQVSSVEMNFEPSIGIMARKVDKLGADIRSFRVPLTEAVKTVVIPSIQMNFHKSGRPRWIDDAESTWAKKRSGSKILIESGALMRGMRSFSIWHVTRETALLNDLPKAIWYGKVHQAGMGSHEAFFDPVKKATVNIGETGAIPARPFVMLQEEDLPKIDEVFNIWLGERVRAAGL